MPHGHPVNLYKKQILDTPTGGPGIFDATLSEPCRYIHTAPAQPWEACELKLRSCCGAAKNQFSTWKSAVYLSYLEKRVTILSPEGLVKGFADFQGENKGNEQHSTKTQPDRGYMTSTNC